MLPRRRLTWMWGLEGPPLASVTLMLLLGVFWLLGVCENLSLAPALLFRRFQVYRLATYCLCHTDPSLLLLNLLLFPVLGWRQERHQGTLRYLHASLLSAVISALLYLVLAGLWAPPPDAASGYTPVHLAMLGRHLVLRSRAGALGQVRAVALPWLLLAFSQLLSPGCPFLLHLSGALTGLALADWSRVLSWLELSERRLEVLDDGAVCRTLARSGFVRFILCPRGGILPTSHAASTRGRSPGHSAPPAQQCFSGGLSDQSLAVAPASPWAAERPGCWQSSGMPYPSVPLACFPDLHGGPAPPPPWDSPSLHSGASLLGLGEVLLDEQLLLAGIQASLRDASLEAAVGGVQLSKSSVSSLRLQQLERMGFPTEQAVVALAATGRVEGAVSLLIGGQVGDEAVVTLESRAACREHLLPTEQAVPCFPTTE
ncbi:rhomboid domain-containing protein 3 isoform X1 [Terrapene carolina triunguis]|uniref:rhomboid domain-containing protein 3 isoform X1 n=1 Tax=Terrapene triunguis TaxID=2587831 RepID=UPI000CEF6825|nr:rhomboid domain-containing protein 3 isoform X1 [Terrapene carolina triunguis]XP_026517015.1 rhomboid domain-containing protein 3 isoform X1 [Terrapene carolina triunguis]XP_026517016.1 rhomboid domain-containing protein 3 isoform X1 [Terrapene carolina triunguis]XP_026517017.1 rhomboid domain-containing protein 3 isoform X1 [Terrapene carolina triunguis]